MAEAYQGHVQKLRAKIAKLKKSDKAWWRLNAELLQKRAKQSSIPPLRTSDGKWHLESKAKADIFAAIFSEKNALPDPVEDQFVGAPTQFQEDFVAIRCRSTLKLLRNLNVFKATGPDHIPAKILKGLAEVLALPLTLLRRRILQEGM